MEIEAVQKLFDESLGRLWTIVLWYLGINTTLMAGLMAWLLYISGKVRIKQDLHKDIDDMSKDVREIKAALIGDFDKKGLVTKHHELSERVQYLEEKRS